MPSFVYPRGNNRIVTGEIDLSTDDIRALAFKNAFPSGPAASTIDFVSEFLAQASDELVGGGYARHIFTSEVVLVDDAANTVTFDAEDPNFGPVVAGETTLGILIFKQVTTDADSPLIACLDIPDQPTDGNDHIIALNSAGIFRYNHLNVPT